MNTFSSINTSVLASLTILGSAALPTVAAADSCAPRVMESHTEFPGRSQLRGQAGTVFVSVMVDADGRAMQTSVQKSSGHRLLDRAATNSVRDNWLFDVSTCERKDLPINHVVAIEYRNPEYQD